MLVEFGEHSGIARDRRVSKLYGREHMPVREPRERMQFSPVRHSRQTSAKMRCRGRGIVDKE